MMARDKHRIDVDVYILQLIFDIVKVETIGATDSSSVEFKEFANKVCQLISIILRFVML